MLILDIWHSTENKSSIYIYIYKMNIHVYVFRIWFVYIYLLACLTWKWQVLRMQLRVNNPTSAIVNQHLSPTQSHCVVLVPPLPLPRSTRRDGCPVLPQRNLRRGGKCVVGVGVKWVLDSNLRGFWPGLRYTTRMCGWTRDKTNDGPYGVNDQGQYWLLFN